MSELNTIIDASHERMDDRYESVIALDEADRPGSPQLESLIEASCAHINAVCEVLVPVVTKRGGLRHGYLDTARELEREAFNLRKRYDSDAWEAFDSAFHELRREEDHVLDAVPDPDTIAPQFATALINAPTHPHPHLFHTGRLGNALRHAVARNDRGRHPMAS